MIIQKEWRSVTPHPPSLPPRTISMTDTHSSGYEMCFMSTEVGRAQRLQTGRESSCQISGFQWVDNVEKDKDSVVVLSYPSAVSCTTLDKT
jgi:hypothetical protein